MFLDDVAIMNEVISACRKWHIDVYPDDFDFTARGVRMAQHMCAEPEIAAEPFEWLKWAVAQARAEQL